MWDLFKSLVGAIFDIIVTIFSFLLDVVLWLFKTVIDIAVWVFKNVISLFFQVLADLIVNHTFSFLIALAVLIVGYVFWDRYQRSRRIIPTRFYQDPKIMIPLLLPFATLLIGLVAESGPISIEQNIQQIQITGDVTDSTVQIGSSEPSGFLSIPTAIWAALITAIATVAAAYVGVKGKTK